MTECIMESIISWFESNMNSLNTATKELDSKVSTINDLRFNSGHCDLVLSLWHRTCTRILSSDLQSGVNVLMNVIKALNLFLENADLKSKTELVILRNKSFERMIIEMTNAANKYLISDDFISIFKLDELFDDINSYCLSICSLLPSEDELNLKQNYCRFTIFFGYELKIVSVNGSLPMCFMH
ncbi:hypothetical protein ACOME3_009671 [Neoechinorhynchus agilis]